MKGLLFLFSLLCSASLLQAQVRLQVPANLSTTSGFVQNPGNSLFISSGTENNFALEQQRPQRFLPDYAQENPQGLSYLCRLELDIEKKLPLGVWIKIDEGSGLGVSPRNNAYVRFKLFNF